VAVRAVHDVRLAHPKISIVGAGGIATGHDAAELMIAGANAVQVGTAIFADPRAPWMVLDQLRHFAARRRIQQLSALTSAIHGGGM
jgi:dihydroorotate dehydrogenase (NAD+) catalytic subunit